MHKLFACLALLAGIFSGFALHGHYSEHQDLHSFEHMPEEFTVTERWFSWSSAFDIESNTHKLGVVRRRIFSLTTQYDFYDVNDFHRSTAKMRFFSFGAVFDVKDVNDVKLGCVEERVFSFFPTFRVFSPHGHILATARMNFWGTSYTIKSPIDDHVIAMMTRPFFSFRDHWTIKILDPMYFVERGVHPHLFITIAAFQTDLDNWRRQAQAASSSGSYDSGWEYSIAAKNGLKAELPEESDTFFNQVKELKAVIDACKPSVPEEEPTEEDVEAAAALIETAMENRPFEKSKEALTELLTSQSLPAKQRSAMLLLLEKKLTDK